MVPMVRGGARNRSGPQADPTSGRSERRGYKLTALPSEGYQGEPPAFPLEPIMLFTEYWEGEGKSRTKVKEPDDGSTESFRDRESQVWAEAWRTPQACAWSMQSWRWPVVAEYCRLKTVVELDPSASAALVAQLHRYRDQIGLTPAGLKENGWAIAVDEVGQRAAERSEQPVEPAVTQKPQRRMRAVAGGGA
jgi:hypothetical protein